MRKNFHFKELKELFLEKKKSKIENVIKKGLEIFTLRTMKEPLVEKKKKKETEKIVRKETEILAL